MCKFNKMIYVAVILVSLIVIISGQQTCDVNCAEVECVSSITQADCPVNNFLAPAVAGSCKCCPGCATGINLNTIGCNVQTNNCRPGLVCIASICRVDQKKCSHLIHIKSAYRWVPECNEQEGTYKTVQCKGDRASGRCFCFTEVGERIFGWDWWRNAADMTCSCSNKRYQIEASGKISTLHCTQNGNYEELQCEDDICWCAEPKTGELQEGTAAVPYAMWNLLPCYNVTQMGSSYLRQCESIAHAQSIIKRKFALHGANTISMQNVLCDYDGTYGIYAVSGGQAYCIWRDGSRIGSYQVEANAASAMKCNCARDSKIFELSGFSLTLSCSGNGNYENLQEQNLQYFCVDDEGFAMSELLPITPVPECNKYFYNMYVPPNP